MPVISDNFNPRAGANRLTDFNKMVGMPRPPDPGPMPGGGGMQQGNPMFAQWLAQRGGQNAVSPNNFLGWMQKTGQFGQPSFGPLPQGGAPQVAPHPQQATLGGASQGAGGGLQHLMGLLQGGGQGAGAGLQQMLPILMQMFGGGAGGLQGLGGMGRQTPMGGGGLGPGFGGPIQQGPNPFQGRGTPGNATIQGMTR